MTSGAAAAALQTRAIATNANAPARSIATVLSRLLFLAEFLKARIVPEWIEHWIEAEQRRSEGQAHNLTCYWTLIRYRE